MEKYTMFMDQKIQYSENEYTTQSNLQIQCNPYQIISQFVWKYKKTSNSQSNLDSLLHKPIIYFPSAITAEAVPPHGG